MYNLISIKKANDGKHKYAAQFKNKETGRLKNTKFGAAGYQDYTLLPAAERDERKRLYRIRHAGDNLTDPTSAGALSWHVLWNKPSFTASVADYKKHFGL